MEATTEPHVHGAIILPVGSERVIDPDEEARPHPISVAWNGFRGLGHLDSRTDKMIISFELPDSSAQTNLGRKQKKPKPRYETLEITLAQDKTALRTRKGDTGSVVWKASIDFAQLVLRQCHSHISADVHTHFLRPSILATQSVLELGAGTGLLGIAMAPLVRKYTITDIGPLMPLLRKNLAANFSGWPHCAPASPGSNINVQELDWQVLHATASAYRSRVFSFEPIDILLIVDCIYHPSLLPSLVETINYLTTPGVTSVIVLVELRAEDVVREFLRLWLEDPGWKIWRFDGDCCLGNPYSMWLGVKE
ncbi:putative methyltransferase-domain-containing protein [Infundibulicybe gibba]|nr:putative methyltransferase-domain-containing protein [Infundibulicybe gibba]